MTTYMTCRSAHGYEPKTNSNSQSIASLMQSNSIVSFTFLFFSFIFAVFNSTIIHLG